MPSFKKSEHKVIQLAVLFSDIVGSSHLYSRFGNEQAKNIIDSSIQGMINIIIERRGKVVKTIGDEVMAAFLSMENAFDCAREMNIYLSNNNQQLRTGICFGQAIIDKRDLFGDTVNNAAYLTKLAQPEQILTNEQSLIKLPQNLRDKCESIDRINLKGDMFKSNIYRCNWEGDNQNLEATLLSARPIDNETSPPTGLKITYEGNVVTIPTNGNKVIIGRDTSSVDLCISDLNTSRQHCSIYYHRHKFILQDHSSNGTYLYPASGGQISLRKESTHLSQKGKITLGKPKETAKTLLEYIQENE